MVFFKRDEVAKQLKIHPRTVERWLQNGSLYGYKLGKGRTSVWRIRKADLELFLKKHKN